MAAECASVDSLRYSLTPRPILSVCPLQSLLTARIRLSASTIR